MRPTLLVLPMICGLMLVSPADAAAAPELAVEPAQVTLSHADDRQQLLVTGKQADGSLRDLTRSARYTSANPEIAQVSPEGVVTPRAPGQALIQIVSGDATAQIEVVVKDVAPRPISFTNDLMPILARAGCNSGACHGAASGKKGFKVSLRGYDAAADYAALSRGSDGRRLNFNEPEKSLFLLKPLGLVPHEGGKRFETDSRYAQVLRRWIGERAGTDTQTAPKLVSIAVSPESRTYSAAGQTQQLLVTARYADGSSRDVTADARYSSSNESAADVGESGLIKLGAKGEAAVMVRYGHVVAVSHFAVMEKTPSFAWSGPPEINYIDKLVNVKLRQMEILPSELATDEEFLRRAFYDVIGLPPTPEEVRAFLADNGPDKRARIIDRLLERPEHAEFWALKWGDLLKIRFDLLQDKGTWSFYRWIRDSIARNQRFDGFVRDILTAEGSCAENPPANFWRIFQNSEDASEAAVQVFAGVRLLCAKCHDHPFEKWVQKDYYGMSAFFGQVGRKPGSRREDVVIYRNPSVAQARHPSTGETLSPKFLDGAAIPVAADQDARRRLADWLTRKDNPFLARATVNRLWSHIFGRGIIDPVDDIRSSNPPSNPALLEALTKDFLDKDFDVRHTLRTILNSRTYQLAARTNPSNAVDTANFSHRLPRRLSAEQLLDSLSQATGIRESFRSRYGEQTVAQPAGGLRAGQIPDRMLTAEMLDLFGRPRGESSCACERNEEASLTQALHMINGKSLSTRLANTGGWLAKLLQTPNLSEDQIIEEVYVNVLCRLPKAAEVERVKKYFADSGDRTKAAQDVMWALFNTKEFLFNY